MEFEYILYLDKASFKGREKNRVKLFKASLFSFLPSRVLR